MTIMESKALMIPAGNSSNTIRQDKINKALSLILLDKFKYLSRITIDS